MKLTTGLFYTSAILHQTCAFSPKAYVYTFDGSSKHQPTSKSPSVFPTTARLLFAQRLGLSQFHSLDHADENTIGIINKLGGIHEEIFIDGDERKADQKVLVFVENVERPEGMGPNQVDNSTQNILTDVCKNFLVQIQRTRHS